MTGSSAPSSRLSALQADLLRGFFEREQRFFLTGGGALAGFYLGHRDTDDLDLFSPPGPDLGDAAHALQGAAAACGASTKALRTYPDFRRFMVSRGEEQCIVDLVIDRAPSIEEQKTTFGEIRVDSLREIAANKLCTILGRSEIKDLVDVREVLNAGVDLEQALEDAQKKDGGVDPATIAWLLSQLTIGHDARLPGGVAPDALLEFRDALVPRLRALAFQRTRQ